MCSNNCLKHKDYQIMDNSMKGKLRTDFQKYTLGLVKIKTNWLNNRLGDGDGKWWSSKDYPINKDNFVQGCAMDFGKILRRLEKSVKYNQRQSIRILILIQ